MSPAPETLLPILTALSSALSPSQAEREASLAQLQAWATVPNYYPSLVEIFANKEHDLGAGHREIRLQAAVQFKNGVDKYWRRAAVNAIAPEEKRSIRPRLLAMVDEPDRVLAKNVALCIAKIARLDYGVDWDELPTSLLSSLQVGLSHPTPSTARIILHRTLLYLHESIKSLSSNRMPKGRALMAQVAQMTFPTLRQLHEQTLAAAVDKFQKQGLGGEKEEVEEIELALLGFKALSKLLVYGFKNPSQDEMVKSFFTATLPALSSLISLRITLLTSTPNAPPSQPLTLLTKQVISYGKLYRLLFNHNGAAFLAMNLSSQIIETYWHAIQGSAADVSSSIADEVNALYPERFVVQALLLLQSTLGNWASASPVDVSPEFVKQFAELLVTRLLPLRQVDLEKWADDPEEYMNEEEADRWEYELRPCAEHVLQSLLSHYKDDLGPSMAGLLQQASAPQSMEGLLLKEGVYCAFGRSPSDLEAAINFDNWLDNTLIPEAAGTDSNYRIIRRRIAWLVGNWVGEDLQETTRTKIYSLLVHLLGRNPSTDTAIRLTAARSLAKCDTWDFDRDSFVSFLPAAIEEIVSLLGEVTLADSQMRLNQTLGVVIDRVGSHITPYAARLAEILVTLWSAAQENHFQTSVLVTFIKLSEALGDQSQGLQPQACPIIQLSVDPSRPSHIYLQEDGLELWSVLLKRSSSLSPEMLALLPLLVSLLAAGTDVLPVCFRILESYMLLDATTVLQLCGADLFAAFEDLLGELKLEAVKVILHGLNTVVKTSPIDNWAGTLDSSAAFIKLLTPLSHSETPVLIVTKYLCSVARIVLAGPETFLQLVEAAAVRTGSSSDNILALLLSSWIDRLDNMSQGGQRKLVALALAHLIATTRSVVLERLPDLVSTWSSALAQTEETESGDAELYNIPDDYQSDVEVDYTETLEAKRRQALTARDPVHTMKLQTLIGQKLAEAQALNGGVEAFQATWLARVDPLVLEELVQRLDGRLAG
ncbi:armadillo-type protein [Leucosporidium creatinivorum]|uniref:Armadillo-type protein n=1 Tax=Leucosporidium creatinivorum TaxID=106004 RepID=A0A1Y2EW15_9BASI|nr:armadillo-type protein [Leucosporidium creatinivorum]